MDKNGFSNTNIKTIKGKIKTSMDFWDRKALSIKGKVYIANTILAAKLSYTLKVMPTNRLIIRDFQRMLERYVSNRKVAPDFEQIYTVEQKGGLRLVNILEKIRCFKTKLIFYLIHREKSWEPFGKYWLGLFLRKHDKRFRTNTYRTTTK